MNCMVPESYLDKAVGKPRRQRRRRRRRRRRKKEGESQGAPTRVPVAQRGFLPLSVSAKIPESTWKADNSGQGRQLRLGVKRTAALGAPRVLLFLSLLPNAASIDSPASLTSRGHPSQRPLPREAAGHRQAIPAAAALGLACTGSIVPSSLHRRF